MAEGEKGWGLGKRWSGQRAQGGAGQGVQVVSGGRRGAVCAKALRSGWQAEGSLPPSTVLLVFCDIVGLFLFYV